jgi:hypothetical protein
MKNSTIFFGRMTDSTDKTTARALRLGQGAMRSCLAVLGLMLAAGNTPASNPPPFYLWLEPEWFEEVRGSFAYWTGTAKPTGSWGIAGPGISAEWTQGGESEWNSIGAPAAETSAACHRDFIVPRSGRYRAWVRYVDHRKQIQPFRLAVSQGGKTVLAGEFGVKQVVPANDEYQCIPACPVLPESHRCLP